MVSSELQCNPGLITSWLGVCSWVIAVVALALMWGLAVAFPDDVHKLQVLESVILIPLVWFLHVLGFGIAGCMKNKDNRFSVSGAIADLGLMPFTMALILWGRP